MSGSVHPKKTQTDTQPVYTFNKICSVRVWAAVVFCLLFAATSLTLWQVGVTAYLPFPIAGSFVAFIFGSVAAIENVISIKKASKK